MRVKPLFFIILVLSSASIQAQKIDESSIQQLVNQGNAQFLEGEIAVIMKDTTSPDFFLKTFEELGYENTFVDSMRLTSRVIIKKDHSDLERFLKNRIFWIF